MEKSGGGPSTSRGLAWTSLLRPLRMDRFEVSRVAPLFTDGSQQDAHEFLAYLLDGLHEDLNRVTKRPPCAGLGGSDTFELNFPTRVSVS